MHTRVTGKSDEEVDGRPVATPCLEARKFNTCHYLDRVFTFTFGIFELMILIPVNRKACRARWTFLSTHSKGKSAVELLEERTVILITVKNSQKTYLLLHFSTDFD